MQYKRRKQNYSLLLFHFRAADNNTYYTIYIDSTNHLLLMYFGACYPKWSSPLLLSLFSNCTADLYLEYISNDAIDQPLSEQMKERITCLVSVCYSILRQLFRSSMQKKSLVCLDWGCSLFRKIQKLKILRNWTEMKCIQSQKSK